MSNFDTMHIGGNSIRVQEVDGELYYILKDIAVCLGYDVAHSGRLTVSPSNKRTLKISTTSGIKHCIGENANGIKELLLSSRKRTNEHLNKYFEVDIKTQSILCKESQIGSAITKTFSELNIVPQYKVILFIKLSFSFQIKNSYRS